MFCRCAILSIDRCVRQSVLSYNTAQLAVLRSNIRAAR